MMCPRCKRDHDILAYRPMLEIEEHRNETVPIYKCPSCTWEFALSPKALHETLREDMER